MNPEKLLELLTLVGEVKSTRWSTVMKLVDVISKQPESLSIIVKDKKWNDTWKQNHPEYYPLNLSEINTWSTFDDTCIDLRFSNYMKEIHGHYNNQLVCNVKIYDGTPFRGERQSLRFEAEIWLPTSFIHIIEQSINWNFERFLEDNYESYLESQKKIWIDNMRNEIINN